MLALVVVLDLVTAWNAAWQTLAKVEVNEGSFTIGLFETGLYFLAATLLWPDEPEAWPDLNRWFDRHKRQIGAAIALANVGFSLIYLHVDPGHYDKPHDLIVQLVYVASALALTVTRRRWQSAIALILMLAILVQIVIAPLL